MIWFPFVPFGTVVTDGAATSLSALGNAWGLAVVSFTAALIYLVDIFLFSNLRRQRLALKVAVLLSCVSAGIVIYLNIAARTAAQGLVWDWGCAMLVGAVALGLAAWRCIRSDELLLSSADRLR